MAEYYAVLSKAVAGLTESAESRRKVYDKARNALIGQLKAINPPLPTAEISRQRLELEEAIRRVEREASTAAMSASPPAPRHQPPPAAEAPVPGDESPRDVFRRAVEQAQTGPHPAGDAPADPYPSHAWPDQDAAAGGPAPADPFPPPEPEPEPYQPPAPSPDAGGARYVARSDERMAAGAPPPQPDDRYRAPAESANVEFAFDWDSGGRAAPGVAPDPYVEARASGRRGRRRRDEADDYDAELARRPQRRSRLPAILLTIFLLAVIGGLGALVWSQRDMVLSLIESLTQSTQSQDAGGTFQPEAGGFSEPPKADDRLTDESGVRIVGPQPDDVPTTTADGGDLNALVAQQATLYEEPVDPNAQAAGVVAIDAVVTWSFQAAGANGPEIIAELAVPDRNLDIRLSIRENTDETLPASHLVEVVSQGSILRISQVPRLVLKATEEGRGQPLVGAAAKVADGLFWIALSATPSDVAFNQGLLRERNWLDLPLVYESGQRAILTFEKGTPGQRVVEQAIAGWGG